MPNQKQDTPVSEKHKVEIHRESNRALPFHTTYDALGRRVQRATKGSKENTKFIYDGQDVLVDDNLGTLTKYQNGLGIDNKLRVQTGSDVNYFLADHLGSTNGLANSSGNLTSSASYDSFGNATGNLNTRYQFTGREFDSISKLNYYRARFYDGKLGRFISEDPIGFAGGDVNLYGYVRNNSIRLRDPSGKIPPIVIGGIIVAGLILTSPEYVNAPGPGDPTYRPENPIYLNGVMGMAGGYLLNKGVGALASRFCRVKPSGGGSSGSAIREGVEEVANGVFNSVDDLPAVRPGFERVYRGSARPDIPQLSPSMRGRPPEQIPSGADEFLNATEAKLHSGIGHPDGISVSTDYGTAKGFGGGNVIIYDVPKGVMNNLRINPGDPAQFELIFRYSIPEAYRIGVISR